MKTNLFNSKFLLAGTMMVSLVLGLASCEKDEPEVTKEEVKTENVESKTLDPVYFSFEQGKVVTISDASKSKDWDIAFMRYYVRTNSGASGSGQGGAIETNITKIDEVTKLASTNFIVDTEITVNVPNSGMPPKTTKIPGNTTFSVKRGENTSIGWANGMGGNWVFNNNVFIVRTANGKYAKVIMKSFVDGDGKITFDYIYPFVPKP